MASRLRDHPAGLHLGLMLALTFSTGVADAVGYLGLDRVFTGNMTGNVVILAMALTGADGLPIWGPLLALALFLVGAAISGRTLRGLPAGWSLRTTVLLGVVSLLLLAAAILAFASADSRPQALAYVVTGLLALAMGMQAGAARHIGVADITTVVVTSTLVGLAFDSRFGRGTATHPWARRAGAILLIGAGAAAGALLLRLGLGWPALLAAVITGVVTVLGTIGRPHTD
ncbi:YoaK family protein [Pseudolysinimonas sp.]|uniref:YoaK family protein n=1 Tax=Pseudolysinimonas sp. TaxID=2680009 RepID=UPI003F7CDF7F